MDISFLDKLSDRSQGLTTEEIQSRPGEETWEIWKNGCGPSGETPEQVSARADLLIEKVRNDFHRRAYASSDFDAADILFVAHGHILRTVAARWLGLPISFGRSFQLDAGGSGILSYEHHRLDEPAVYVLVVSGLNSH